MTSPTQRNDRRRFLIGALILTAACALVYLPALRGQFIWDDDRHVSENRALRDLAGLKRIWLEPGATPQYYPLTHTSWWIEYHLWRLNTLGYHASNVLLHAGVAVALWHLLRRLGLPGCFLAALLFAVHPLQVETVAWISERKNILSALFELLALIAYLRWDEQGRARWSLYLVALALFMAAMLSKTVACSMPAVILVIAWWRRGRIARRDVLPLLPMFAIGGLLAWQTAVMERDHVGAAGADWTIPFAQRIEIASRAVWFYAAKIIWPTRLTFSYPRWNIQDGGIWRMMFAGLLVATIAALIALRRRIGRGPLAATLIFAGVLVPALGLINTYPMRYSFVADHFQYVAGMALITLLATLLARLHLKPLLVAAALVSCVLTWRQARIYRDSETLWRDTIAKNPRSWMAQNNLGAILTQAGDVASLNEALSRFDAVEKLKPEHERLPFNRAETYMRLGRWQEAIDQYRQGLARPAERQSARTVARTYDRIGEALMRSRRRDDAIREFQTAVAIDPALPEARLYLASALELARREREAVVQFRAYLQLNPRDAAARISLGNLLGTAGDFASAADEFSAALSIEPNNETARQRLTLALQAQREKNRRPPASTRASGAGK